MRLRLILLPLALAACKAQAAPEPSSPGASGGQAAASQVVDDAGMFAPPQKADLDRQLQAYWAQTRTAIVVASIPSLQGQPINDIAYRLYNGWGIGDRTTMRGLLVLVAPNDRQVRIEVGCGLELVITDTVARDIIEQDMVPRFKAGDMAGGTVSGVDALITAVDHGKDSGPVSDACRALMKKAA